MKRCVYFLFLFTTFSSTDCHKKDPLKPQSQALFDSVPTSVTIAPQIQEASGIADSKTVSQTLWVEEDSGNPPQLYSLNYDGTVRKTVYLKNAVNQDWEDLTIAGGNLYIADIGDNELKFGSYTIYTFPEPTATTDTVFDFEKIRFRYEDGAHDAEAFLVDPVVKDIYIITKRDDPSLIFKIAYPYSTTATNIATKVGQLTYNGIVSAALSPDASEIIVKTYIGLNYYSLNGKNVATALQSQPRALPYKMEPQGEAVTFANNNSGFFTLSEKATASSVALHFYKRK